MQQFKLLFFLLPLWGMQASDAVWQSSVDHLLRAPQTQSVFEKDKKANQHKSNIMGGSLLKVKPTLPLKDLFNTMVCYEFVKSLDAKGLLQEETGGWGDVIIEKHHSYKQTDVLEYKNASNIKHVIRHQWGTSEYKDLCGELSQTVIIALESDGSGSVASSNNYTEQDYLNW
ncbi:hypothetical protein [Abyssogena phaseoliformis symbiont]|uniref:hypothetical protein n=1 Tax=Abyssogena phaseoliformis symbiont TaxID=596095 RepID=UPI0019165A39|nr:hypothetical protein [Abyssogena phaseoliformis symbiont]